MLLRLIWKEWRQGWPLLAAGLLLPPLAVALTRGHITVLYIEPSTIVLFIMMIGISIWAPLLVGTGHARRSYAAVHFPLHPAAPALVTLLVQGFIILLLGASVGLWYANLPFALPLLQTMLLAILYPLAIYLIAAVTALAIKPAMGIVAGVLAILFTMGIAFLPLATPEVSYSHGLLYNGLNMVTIIVLACWLVGSLPAVGLVLSPGRRLLQRRIGALALLVLGLFGYPIMDYLQNTAFSRGYSAEGLYAASADGSVTVLPTDSVYMDMQQGKPVTLQLVDYRANQRVTQQFNMPIKLLGIIDRQSAILLAQRPGEKRIIVYRWTLADNRLEQLARMPARRNVLDRWRHGNIPRISTSQLSPDGRYLLIYLPELVGPWDADDLWLVDLLTHRVRLLKTRTYDSEVSVGWVPGEAIITNYGEPFRVALPSGRMTLYKLPVNTEGKQ